MKKTPIIDINGKRRGDRTIGSPTFVGGKLVIPENVLLKGKEQRSRKQFELKKEEFYKRKNALSMNYDYRVYVETKFESIESKILDYVRKSSGILLYTSTSSYEHNQRPHLYPKNGEVFMMDFRAERREGEKFMDFLQKIGKNKYDVY